MSEQTEEVKPTEEEEDSTVYVFITVQGGEIVSINSNSADLDIKIIDKDIGEISEEVAKINEDLEANQAWMEETYTTYDYCAQEGESPETTEEVK